MPVGIDEPPSSVHLLDAKEAAPDAWFATSVRARGFGTALRSGLPISTWVTSVEELSEAGDMTILLVEQYYDFARSLANQYLIMDRGEIVARGRGEDMDADGVRSRLAV